MVPQNMKKQVDENPGDVICFRNESQGGFAMKPAQALSIDCMECIVPDWFQGYWTIPELVKNEQIVECKYTLCTYQ